MRMRKNNYNHIYHIKKKNDKKGIPTILEIMDRFDLDYDCDLFEITRIIERMYPKVVDRTRLGVNYIYEIQAIIKIIKENDMLGRCAS